MSLLFEWLTGGACTVKRTTHTSITLKRSRQYVSSARLLTLMMPSLDLTPCILEIACLQSKVHPLQFYLSFVVTQMIFAALTAQFQKLPERLVAFSLSWRVRLQLDVMGSQRHALSCSALPAVVASMGEIMRAHFTVALFLHFFVYCLACSIRFLWALDYAVCSVTKHLFRPAAWRKHCYFSSVISAKSVSMLAINARVPGWNPTIDGYFSLSKRSESLRGYCSAIKMPAVKFSWNFYGLLLWL